MRWSGHGDDAAVSEVVGTLLLVAISIVLFSGLSVVVYQQMQTSPVPANVDLRLEVDGDWTTMTHVWGESLPVDEVRLLIEVGGTRGQYDLDEAPLADHLDHVPSGSVEQWDLGETLWLRCPSGGDCAFPSETLGYVTSVDERANAVVFSNQPGVTPGLILNPLPDLSVATEPVEDLSPADGMYEDCQYVFRAVVANTGLEPTEDPIVTKFYLDGDGTAFHTDTRSTPLQVGSSYVVTVQVKVSGAGQHQFLAVVDKDNTIPEISEENEDDRTFNLDQATADPGFVFEDGDGDLLYTGCDGDTNVQALLEDDGAHSTAAGIGLVIPPSVSISLTSPITLSSGGVLVVGGGLTAGGAIDLDADGNVDASDGILSAEGYAITIDSTTGSVVGDRLSVPAGASSDTTRVEVRAAGFISLESAQIYTQDAVFADAAGTGTSASGASGSLLMQSANLVANPGSGLFSGDAIRLAGDGDVRAENAFLKTKADLIGVDVDVTSNTFFYESLNCETLSGNQNSVVLTPLGANKAAGTGAACTVA